VAVLCLGEALVDLICERPVDDLAQAPAFVPAFGGAVANVAVVAARAGAAVSLAGGAGDDRWGAWLCERLAAEGVGLDWFELVPGARTPLAFVVCDASGEPTYEIHGEGIPTVVNALAERLDEAIGGADGLFISSNTLVGEDEREVTLRARALALEQGRPVVFDPNLRLHRWPSHTAAAAAANECVPGALLVRCNRAEAAVMTREDDPERAAAALLKAGARMALITLGAQGAILRGEVRANAPGVPAEVLSTVGAGDTLTGIVLARLALSDWYPAAAAAVLPQAVAAAARATERWSALA
jgi:fructokinase